MAIDSTVYVDDIREIKEQNPFESMMSRFDRAAQLLDLPARLVEPATESGERDTESRVLCRPRQNRRSTATTPASEAHHITGAGVVDRW